ncbi:hypothetical protein AB9P05_12150 [Roseivirga sp. BDSF3-8]|uniref:hypothetical protein n=1 Tax=Roseivirga sp. BDSF3-8 TaxID=3241598 RepID=UPI003531C2D3
MKKTVFLFVTMIMASVQFSFTEKAIDEADEVCIEEASYYAPEYVTYNGSFTCGRNFTNCQTGNTFTVGPVPSDMVLVVGQTYRIYRSLYYSGFPCVLYQIDSATKSSCP